MLTIIWCDGRTKLWRDGRTGLAGVTDGRMDGRSEVGYMRARSETKNWSS